MRSLAFLIYFLLATTALIAQETVVIQDDDSVETNAERVDLMAGLLATMDFHTVADIGSGNMAIILQVVDRFPDKTYVFEDIDKERCNRARMQEQLNTLQLTHVDTSRISIHIGDTSTTGLPGDRFDLVILSGMVHVIGKPEKFFAEIERILRPGGDLIIADAFYASPPAPHPDCEKPFLTHDQFNALLREQNLTILREHRQVGLSSRSNGPYVSKVVQCRFE